jgi:predicted nucleotidyltransferase
MHDKRRQQLESALADVLSTLISKYQPDKIILFGSVATGQVAEWSDIDLLIVKDTDVPFLERLKEVALLCAAPVGVDYFVYTQAELDAMIDAGNPFIRQALKEGQPLYDRGSVPIMA